VLDVPVPGAHDIIGDRAYSLDPAVVVALGRATMDGYLDGGVLPVIKHIPGHGRALADSHLSLPRVDTSTEELATHDFAPFCALRDAPIAMTAHVVYEAIDAERPATTSPLVVGDIIREAIGFDGLLMSDDLSMAALKGSLASRTSAALTAGCDIALHCNGKLDEMKEVASASHQLSGKPLTRADDALARRYVPAPLDAEEAEKRLAAMLGLLA
jgi:beta-N-acetylhexosaminidase